MPNLIRILYLSLLCTAVLLAPGCKNEPATQTQAPPKPPKRVKVPKFDRDTAYAHVQKQVDFGPRVPNSPGHAACRDWLAAQLQRYNLTVVKQGFKATAYTGTTLHGTNIIGRYKPNQKKRILLAAHWDTRHIADHDPDQSRQNQPILGADDGASGVGVLLEIARQLQANPIEMGVDIIFFDAEDHGSDNGQDDGSWALGAQHWARTPHISGYRAKSGILLDMVGAEGARFPKEGYSMTYAESLTNKIWKRAQGMGYGQYFVDKRIGAITDDHRYVNEIARIPMTDIIHRADNNRFGPHWHTHKDDMPVISKRTLRAVGQTVLAVIYSEASGTF